ncbi:transposable element Tcb1 transposase [Trichonephila clavipes]|nr:transposable element Tcb1 transposase [Trichonephila clavipes]
MKERSGWQNGMKLFLLTSHTSVENTKMVGFVWRHRGERMLNSCVMHHHTDPASGVIGLVTAIFQEDNARPHVAGIVQRFLVNHQIELLPLPALSQDLSSIENMWPMFAERLTQITPPAAIPTQFWQRVEAAFFGLLYPNNTSKVSLN